MHAFKETLGAEHSKKYHFSKTWYRIKCFEKYVWKVRNEATLQRGLDSRIIPTPLYNTFSNILFSFPLILVDGGYSPWSSYSECSEPCGDGLMTRKRTCTNPSPAHGGKQCQGASTEEKQCKVKECPGITIT